MPQLMMEGHTIPVSQGLQRVMKHARRRNPVTEKHTEDQAHISSQFGLGITTPLERPNEHS